MEHKNPWLSIWTQPRATIAHIVAKNPNRSLWWLAAIYGLCSLLNFFQSMSLGNSMGTVWLVILAIILAPIYGYVTFAVWSWFVLWTGKLFRGKGTFKTVRASYAWSCVPIVVNIPLWLLLIVVFQGQLFQNFSDSHSMATGQVFVLLAILVIKVILAIWSLVIFINTLAEVQNYSIVRSILNIVLAAVVMGILFFILWSLLIYMVGSVAASPLIFFKPV